MVLGLPHHPRPRWEINPASLRVEERRLKTDTLKNATASYAVSVGILSAAVPPINLNPLFSQMVIYQLKLLRMSSEWVCGRVLSDRTLRLFEPRHGVEKQVLTPPL